MALPFGATRRGVKIPAYLFFLLLGKSLLSNSKGVAPVNPGSRPGQAQNPAYF